ncbi:glycogen synthase GlgA [Ligilactobacillus acidipiscis]|uniref:glycogen synthase GlgA n=1 Tax=Ligilactobacillus acidipiscis TaxID=89059 RepID=UPI0023F96165|nr:glycogen synthase GlgA [Ligilactobacillus acidipiscis]WEV57085.1 glycogen synthase GlgA [Ligilactobacillus acidipiscis]
MKKILFAAAEGAPFYKTGGLGDVMYALPKALAGKSDLDIRVVLPYYASLMPEQYQKQLKDVTNFEIKVGQNSRYVGIKSLQLGQVLYYFIDNLEYFGRDGLYGYGDDGERFGFYQMALIEMLEKVDFIPDVLHINDWHTAFIPVLLQDKYSWLAPLRNIKTILTIHNIKFQGVYDPIILDSIFGIGRQYFNEQGFKYYDAVNFMKGGIEFADKVTTVSPSYAAEIQTPEFGEGLDGILRENSYKLTGFLNGIDTELYDPQTDKNIAINYSIQDFDKQKAKNKVQLQKELNLPQEDVPLLILISRLTRQKGLDIFLAMLDDFLVLHHVQIALLGTGDSDLENDFKWMQERYPAQFSANIRFDEKLAQQMYAAGDLILVPSAFEPCGLSQMMGMRYGAVPVVHETGGLRDTVPPYNEYTNEGLGFSFASFDAQTLNQVLSYAYDIFTQKPAAFKQIVERDMRADFSWKKSAELYLGMYRELWQN